MRLGPWRTSTRVIPDLPFRPVPRPGSPRRPPPPARPARRPGPPCHRPLAAPSGAVRPRASCRSRSPPPRP
ncbi:MAG: ATPase, partial [Chloroflexi bacterium]|nr:ATPase [Chloroflexota bacterium]